MAGGYHGLDALWEEEAVVEGVHGVVGLHSTLPLQQDGSGVQPFVSPEHCESSFLIAVDQGPGDTQYPILIRRIGCQVGHKPDQMEQNSMKANCTLSASDWRNRTGKKEEKKKKIYIYICVYLKRELSVVTKLLALAKPIRHPQRLLASAPFITSHLTLVKNRFFLFFRFPSFFSSW